MVEKELVPFNGNIVEVDELKEMSTGNWKLGVHVEGVGWMSRFGEMVELEQLKDVLKPGVLVRGRFYESGKYKNIDEIKVITGNKTTQPKTTVVDDVVRLYDEVYVAMLPYKIGTKEGLAVDDDQAFASMVATVFIECNRRNR